MSSLCSKSRVDVADNPDIKVHQLASLDCSPYHDVYIPALRNSPAYAIHSELEVLIRLNALGYSISCSLFVVIHT